jgi:ribosomal protein S18 acetylase RimI-like enzyme
MTLHHTVHIREAGPADIPAITAVAEATWEPTYRAIITSAQIQYMYAHIYAPEALTQQMNEWKHTFLLLSVDEVPSAFAAFAPRPEAPTTFKLHKIYLLPNLQGQGLGKQLITEVGRRVRAAGGTQLDLNVNRLNLARFFYERNGFRILREEDVPIGPFWMNDFVMRKPL